MRPERVTRRGCADGDGGDAAVDRGDAGESTIAKGTAAVHGDGNVQRQSTQNLTASVTWASTTPATATINASGLAAALQAGSTTISATSGAIVGSTTLTVTAATGEPLIHAAVLLTGTTVSGQFYVDVQFTNAGTGNWPKCHCNGCDFPDFDRHRYSDLHSDVVPTDSG